MMHVHFIFIIVLVFASDTFAQPTLQLVLKESHTLHRDVSQELPPPISHARKIVGARIIRAQKCDPVPSVPGISLSEIWSIYVGTGVWYCRVFHRETKELLYAPKNVCTQQATHPDGYVYWEKMIDQRWFLFLKGHDTDAYYFAHVSQHMCQLDIRHIQLSFELLKLNR